jgi:hypothetical protein
MASSDSEPPRAYGDGSGTQPPPSGAPAAGSPRSSPPPPRTSPPPPLDGRAERHERHDDPDRKRRFAERVVPVIVKRLVERAVESGVEKLAEQPENLRNFIADLKLPKEVLQDVYGQIDDTKNGLYRVVAKEIRDVLEHTQVADEIVKVLTKLSFEIKTEIRFVPNDAADGARRDEEGDPGSAVPVKPRVTSEVTMRDRGQAERPRR